MSTTIITALDFGTEAEALRFVDAVGDSCDFYKVGLELFTASGPPVVEALRARGKRVFLDLKFHDIPNTVRGAARNAARLGASLVTVHVSGGSLMLEAAIQGAGEGSTRGGDRCKVFGVSVLTSLDATMLARVWGRTGGVLAVTEVVRLAHVARDSGLDGLVCGAGEAAEVRTSTGGSLELLVPGIRLAGGASHDQIRVATPAAARAAGASYIVVGRAVTQAPDPVAVLHEVQAQLARR